MFLWLTSRKGKIRQEKEINLPDRTSTPYSVCDKNAVEPVSRHAPPAKLACISDKTWRFGYALWICLLIYSFLALRDSPIPHYFHKRGKKKVAKQAMREKELRRTEGKKHCSSKTTHHLSSYLFLLLIKRQHPSFPSWQHSRLSGLHNPRLLRLLS